MQGEAVHRGKEETVCQGRGRPFLKRGRRPSSKGRASLLREGGGHKGEGKLFVKAGEPIGQGKDKAVVKGGRIAVHQKRKDASHSLEEGGHQSFVKRGRIRMFIERGKTRTFVKRGRMPA